MARHFILTRFNLNLWKADKRGAVTQTEEWLERRCLLFEKYTLPSICAQTEKNFYWVVLFSSDTPEKYKIRVNGWAKACNRLKPIWVRPEVSWHFTRVYREVIKNALESLEKGNDCRITTTYLDSDDALHKDYMAKVVEATGNVGHNTMLSFTPGLQYYSEPQIAMGIDYRNNHFLTYVEDVKKGCTPITVHGFGGHHHILHERRVNLHVIDTGKSMMWLEIVHGINVDNDVIMTFRQWPVFRRMILKSDYGIDEEMTRWPCIMFVCHWIPRAMYQFCRRLKHKIFGHDWHEK